MTTTKQEIIDLIRLIGDKIDDLSEKSIKQDQFIKDLQSQNEELKMNNQTTLNQIKEYVDELKKIRNHYVDSNNNIM